MAETDVIQALLEAVQPLQAKFNDILSDEIPEELPPMQDIHRIDLVPGAYLPDLLH